MNRLVFLAVFFLIASPNGAQLIEPTLEQKAAIISHILRARASLDNPTYQKAEGSEIQFEIQMGLRNPETREILDPNHKTPSPEDLKKIFRRLVRA